MTTLLIDVVSNNSIVALISEGKPKTLEKIALDCNQLHSESIVPALELLISKSTFNYLDIKKVVCVTGPGNYTNIRTGLAVAKSISLVNNIDTYGITQHELIGQTYQYSAISNSFIVITHSTNNNFYYKEFNQNMPDQLDPILLHADEVLNKIDEIKSDIIETGNEFLNYLIKNNLSVKNLTSNYRIPDNNLGKIFESKSIISDNIEAKYIKTPNFVKYKKRDIYE
ncbi:MAG: tRNA (adenosine(37)-N6)-threonylcarbamoyltransferase complex dimerization subunit type 1 TsaB [Pseudomonadota bacterium]|nr:tRNA (adenosine(37)-N6)-threonylcarbamoyltransferase complex dimerization subunit type 1 TsaB [Pseudomonadota bacterium]